MMRRAGFLISVGLILVSALGPLVLSQDPTALGPVELGLQAPTWSHPCGTDVHGRDVLLRLVHGGRVSLLVGWLSVVVAVTLGATVGLAAGLGPRWLDRPLMYLTDAFLAFPRIFLVLLLVSLISPSLWLVMVVLGLTGWMGVARLVRAETLSLRERDFVHAARGLGLTARQVAVRHVLPNLLPTILVAAALRIGGTILTESFLSFLGLGAQAPTISWGAMIQEGRDHLLDGWWLTVFPGLAIALTVVGYNLLADDLRRRMDPRADEEAGS